MRYDYHAFFEQKLRKIAQSDPVLDIGGGKPFQKRMAPYKALFEGVSYRTLDTSAVEGADIVGDAHALPLADGSIGGIICNSVLEHLYDPRRAVEEMHRVLKPGGSIIAYTHFIYPYHARPGVYADYFRFTEDGLRYLFRDFARVEIKKQGGFFRAMGFFLPFQARLKFLWEPLAYALDKMCATERRSTTMAYYIYAEK